MVVAVAGGGRWSVLNKAKMFSTLCQANPLASCLNFDSEKAQKYLMILMTILPSVLFIEICIKAHTSQL